MIAERLALLTRALENKERMVERMVEEIGKVKLDYSKYPGEDFYCDGAIEDEILDIVKGKTSAEYAGIIEERKQWPILYHLSSQRENIIDWIPMTGEDCAEVTRRPKVLEVGSGCGAITGVLARNAGEVTCVDLSKKRSMINAYRHRECDNITIHVGNFKDIEPDLPADYDFIFLIGVFEYGQSYIGGDTPYEDFLKILMPHLAKDGRILIAIENKYGLKYFAGCKEDHLGTYFSGVENYGEKKGVQTFSKKGLERIFTECGVKEYHFYYPYPDYKFMTMLYSDDYLPAKGELSNNLRNFDRDRMLLFDEKRAFDGIVEDGLFPVFSNSYFVVIGRDFDAKYVKYSNDRAPEYAIRTEIVDAGGQFEVRKYPVNEAAAEHVKGMAAAYESLKEKYQGGKLEINRCRLLEDKSSVCAQFEFVQGTALSELMDECLEKDDLEGFYRYFDQYVERVGYNSEYPAADFDLIFSNILVNAGSEDKWTLIDYEWTFGERIDTKKLAFRAVYCYLLEDKKREKLDLGRVLRALSATEEDAEYFRIQEMDFQRFVTGKRASMAELREMMGGCVTVPQKWMAQYQDSEKINRVQIYEDKGNGCREEDSYFVKDAYHGENRIELKLQVSGDVNMLRIDPAFGCCIVKIREMTFNDKEVPLRKRKILSSNGRIVRPRELENGRYCPSIVFATEDPNINIAVNRLEHGQENKLCALLEIVRLPFSIAQNL